MKRAFIGFVVLAILGLCAFTLDHLILQIQNGGNPIATFTNWGVLNFNSGCTTSVSGVTVSISCSGNAVLNALDYGADPTGATGNTDTVVIPRMIAACTAVTGGCELFFPAGRYALSSAGYNVSANSITVAGVGRGTVFTQAARLTVQPSLDVRYMLQLSGQNDQIIGITFAGQSLLATDNTTYQYCIYNPSANNALIAQNFFTGYPTPGVNGCNIDYFEDYQTTGTLFISNTASVPPIGTTGSKGYFVLTAGSYGQYLGNQSSFTSTMGRHHYYFSQSTCAVGSCTPLSLPYGAAIYNHISGNSMVGGTNAVVECNASDTGGAPAPLENQIDNNIIINPSMLYASADVGAIDLNANCQKNKYSNNNIVSPGGGTASGTVNTQNASYNDGAGGSCPSNCVIYASGNVLGPSWTGTITIAGTPYTINSVYIDTTGGSQVLSLTTAPGTQTGAAYSYASAAGAGISVTGDSGASPWTTNPFSQTGTCVRTNNVDVITAAGIGTNGTVLKGQWVNIASETGGAGYPATCNGTHLQIIAVAANTISVFQQGTNTTTNSAAGTITQTPALAEDNEFYHNTLDQPFASGLVCLGCSKETIEANKFLDAGIGGTYKHDLWLANPNQTGASFNRIIGNQFATTNYADYSVVIDNGGTLVASTGNYFESNYLTAGSTGSYSDCASTCGIGTIWGGNYINGSWASPGTMGFYNGLNTAGSGLVSLQAVPAAVSISSATSIAATSLCSTANCPAGTYEVSANVVLTSACSTTGGYIVWLAWTDESGARSGSSTTTFIPIQGTGATTSTGSLALASTANYGQGFFQLRTTGVANQALGSINYGTTAVACGTGGPAAGNLYLSVKRIR